MQVAVHPTWQQCSVIFSFLILFIHSFIHYYYYYYFLSFSRILVDFSIHNFPSTLHPMRTSYPRNLGFYSPRIFFMRKKKEKNKEKNGKLSSGGLCLLSLHNRCQHSPFFIFCFKRDSTRHVTQEGAKFPSVPVNPETKRKKRKKKIKAKKKKTEVGL